jgi:hypothetical protein
MNTKKSVLILFLISSVLILMGSRASASDIELFFQAIKRGDIAKVKMLIEAGADVGARDNEGRNAYKIALYFGHTEIEQMLIPVGFQYGNDKVLLHIHSEAVFNETIGE